MSNKFMDNLIIFGLGAIVGAIVTEDSYLDDKELEKYKDNCKNIKLDNYFKDYNFNKNKCYKEGFINKIGKEFKDQIKQYNCYYKNKYKDDLNNHKKCHQNNEIEGKELIKDKLEKEKQHDQFHDQNKSQMACNKKYTETIKKEKMPDELENYFNQLHELEYKIRNFYNK